MTTLANDTVWRKRLREIDSEFDEVRMPSAVQLSEDMDQDREWCEVRVNGRTRRIRFHNYAEVFRIPGLYERIFYEELECCSPSCVVNLLEDVASDFGTEMNELKVLDVGAGNGMVGDELQAAGVETLIGVDLIEEAQIASERDRPGLYDEYLVTDLTDLPENHEAAIRREQPNCLTTVAALGFGDIPASAFLKALDLIETPGWLAFNIKESFLRDDDTSGFNRLIRDLSREEYIQIQCYRRYQHRLSVAGEPLHYVAVVARKLRALTGELVTAWKEDRSLPEL